MQEDNHIFQGMKRGGHQIKLEANFLWDAHNIRITNREDNSALSITNEKGTSDELFLFEGTYVGHAIIDIYLILFTAKNNNDGTFTSIIYKIRKRDKLEAIILFKGQDLFDDKHYIETVIDYESPLIQKVYWTDGINQPRVINIANHSSTVIYNISNKPLIDYTRTLGYTNKSFDFVQDLALLELVTIEKQYTIGSFMPGVILYAFTYYNKYRQETNIFYTSPLLYISPQDRGGKPNETVSNSFKITLNNIDTNFEYLRIYSIHRASLNTEPKVLNVTDLAIPKTDSLNLTITYTDTGIVGSQVDPRKLLYIGGEHIVAKTIHSKDRTLFMGNITIKRPVINNITLQSIDTIGIVNSRTTVDNTILDSDYYYKHNNLNSFPAFKSGETYRLGIQALYLNGKWSDPIYIRDCTINDNNRPFYNNEGILLNPYFIMTIPSSIVNNLIAKGYKKIRAVTAFGNILDRSIIALGILCPTVFNVKDRKNNAPFAQSSWFFRSYQLNDTDDNNTTTNVESGSKLEYRHLRALRVCSDRGAEIQCNSKSPTFNQVCANPNNYDDIFMVDNSILTFHSPEIEFDSNIRSYIHKNKNCKIRIVGLAYYTANQGDINIITSTPNINLKDDGFIHKTILNKNLGGRGLHSGLFFKDSLVTRDTSDNYKKYNDVVYGFMVYPWHRSGSLNNDIKRDPSKGEQSAKLASKIISNLRFFNYNQWLSSDKYLPNTNASYNGITPILIFDSNEVSLLKLDSPKIDGLQSINYMGNIDSIINPVEEYASAYISDNIYNLSEEDALFKSSIKYIDKSTLVSLKDTVKMKYKSSPHAVFAFNCASSAKDWVLPKIRALGTLYYNTEETLVPYWCSSTIKNKYKYSIITVKFYSSVIQNNLEVGDLVIVNSTDNPTRYELKKVASISLDGTVTYQLILKNSSNKNYIYEAGSSFYMWNSDNSNTLQLKDSSYVNSLLYYSLIPIIDLPTVPAYPWMYIAEIYQDVSTEIRFGGNSESSITNNNWIPASEPISLNNNNNAVINVIYGDTWYTRYDCLKTRPFTSEDINLVVEIGSFMLETRINIDGRYDNNKGLESNLHVNDLNFNLMNSVYSQLNNIFNYRILDKMFYLNDKFQYQLTWSLEKLPVADIDNWTSITLANTLNLNGLYGSITSIISHNDTLLCFLKNAINNILFNSRVQIPTSDGIPIEISNGYKIDGSKLLSNYIGSGQSSSICNTPYGIYFIDSNNSNLWHVAESITNVSLNLGMEWWFKNQTDIIQLYYDDKYNDLYLIPLSGDLDVLCFNLQLQQFTSFLSYGGNVGMFNFLNDSYSLRPSSSGVSLYRNFVGDYNKFFGAFKPWDFTFISNQYPTITKIFDTIEFRGDSFNNTTLSNESPIDYIKINNEYLNAEVSFNDRTLRKKFRVWRGIIPRNNNSRERIRNTWTAITLGNKKETTNKALIHDVSVKYTV